MIPDSANRLCGRGLELINGRASPAFPRVLGGDPLGFAMLEMELGCSDLEGGGSDAPPPTRGLCCLPSFDRKGFELPPFDRSMVDGSWGDIVVFGERFETVGDDSKRGRELPSSNDFNSFEKNSSKLVVLSAVEFGFLRSEPAVADARRPDGKWTASIDRRPVTGLRDGDDGFASQAGSPSSSSLGSIPTRSSIAGREFPVDDADDRDGGVWAKMEFGTNTKVGPSTTPSHNRPWTTVGSRTGFWTTIQRSLPAEVLLTATGLKNWGPHQSQAAHWPGSRAVVPNVEKRDQGNWVDGSAGLYPAPTEFISVEPRIAH
ncbi:MAG: hypothetical protein Q8M16_23085 [Pirellulaceae bacterium]|nr:hypothetical protein [Pirellulaceae bacterium]